VLTLQVLCLAWKFPARLESSMINLQWHPSRRRLIQREAGGSRDSDLPLCPTTIVSTPTIPEYSEPDDGQMLPAMLS